MNQSVLLRLLSNIEIIILAYLLYMHLKVVQLYFQFTLIFLQSVMFKVKFKNTSAAVVCFVLFSKIGQILITTHCMLEYMSGTIKQICQAEDTQQFMKIRNKRVNN